MRFRNIPKKQIYIKKYPKQAGGMSITGLLSLVDYALKIIVFTLLPIAVFTLVTSKIPVWGMQSFVVLSGSMEPTLPVGSIVYTKKENEYKVKDIVSFKVNDTTITHRVMEVLSKPEGIFYRVKGDANNGVDTDLVPASAVLGKGIDLFPFLGYIVVYLKTLPGFIAMIILPSLIFIGFELAAIKKEIEKEVEKKYQVQT